ncbi:hypothetical protein I4U23_004434 [Adineta vaga]|nr:hypothetical protein I4U23_004434 [Adineta vaga]
MARVIRRDCKRKDYSFPYCTVCLDLAKEYQESKIVGALGAMVQSEKFLDLVKNHDERAIIVAQEMFNDDEKTFDFDYQLSLRLENNK